MDTITFEKILLDTNYKDELGEKQILIGKRGTEFVVFTQYLTGMGKQTTPFKTKTAAIEHVCRETGYSIQAVGRKLQVIKN
jgi:hypothetical protein